MPIHIDRKTVNEFGGEAVLEARVEDFRRALEAHALTEDQPAPVEHPFISYIVTNGGWPEVNILEPPPPAPAPNPGRPLMGPAPFIPRGVLTIAEFREAANVVIDHQAEVERMNYITPGAGQALEYRETELEARAWQPGETLENYPFLAAEAEAVRLAFGIEPSPQEVVDEVLSNLSSWRTAGAHIKLLRRSRKLMLNLLGTEEEILEVTQRPWGVGSEP